MRPEDRFRPGTFWAWSSRLFRSVCSTCSPLIATRRDEPRTSISSEFHSPKWLQRGHAVNGDVVKGAGPLHALLVGVGGERIVLQLDLRMTWRTRGGKSFAGRCPECHAAIGPLGELEVQAQDEIAVVALGQQPALPPVTEAVDQLAGL